MSWQRWCSQVLCFASSYPGYGNVADVRHSEEAGFNHHLVKPADFMKVKEILATVTEKTT